MPDTSPTPLEPAYTAPTDPAPEELLALDGRPPRSTAALVALLLALVLIFPWVWIVGLKVAGLDGVPPATLIGALGGLAAVALGVVGILRTAGRKRRGMGMAIAAIPLGLLAAVSQFGIGTAFHHMATSQQHATKALELFKTPGDQLDDAAKSWYDEVASARFRVSVSQEELRTWLQGVLDQYGQLQSWKRDGNPKPGREALLMRFQGQFVNRGAVIDVYVGLENDGSLGVDNIRVGGSSPLK